jgi:TamB, inner membrane protein subunit of TAM complex
LRIDSLAIENNEIGDLRFGATWNNADNLIDLGGELVRGDKRILGFSGALAPGKKEELDVDLLLDRFDLLAIEPYLPEAISDVQGLVTGKIDITGKLAAPQANGEVMLNNAGIRINYLNTKYTFSHPLIIRPDQFAMDNVTLFDGQGGHAKASSFALNHDAFSRWNFDVAAELDHLQVLNTTLEDNQLFYGTAVGSGALNVEGYTENLGITVDAHTEKGTSLHFPLGASTDVGGLSFVRFVKPGENLDSLQAPVDLSGVHLDMKVGVTPDARFELIFDPTVGDIISGSGRGDIAMTVTPSGDFSMKGGLEVVEGDYLFTLRNLVNKQFTVDPGGRITWYGDPFDARLDMNAVYKLRTALYDIIPPGERSEAYRKRVPVEVIMRLSDKLMQPGIGFNVRLPSVDEGVRTQVNSVLSDPDKLNKQVFALLVLNKFVSDDIGQGGSFGQGAGTSAGTTMAEFISSQLSNVISSASDAVDLGINYRPGNSIAADEFEVAVGKAFFNNRVQVSTNVGITGTNTSNAQNGAQFIGDFAVDYLITDDGKLRAKAFSQSNDRNLNQLNQAQTTQGVGLAYNEEFNTLGEFFRKIGNLFRSKAEQRPLDD